MSWGGVAEVKLLQGDNLEALRELRNRGAMFDLVELDGPYMAGLEEWDILTEKEYIQHYADRLSLVREILWPWGVVFVFGYPEGCAEIKSWAHKTKTLWLRRWLNWYKQRTMHKGRKVENILVFLKNHPIDLIDFGKVIKERRIKLGLSLQDMSEQSGRPWWYRGGNLYFETGSGSLPSMDDFIALINILHLNPGPWWGVVERIFPGITDIDYLDKTYPEYTESLNGSGLSSKPIQLYIDLFKAVDQPMHEKRALILYGGSGNAGIAAAALGYDVTICETDPERCDLIRGRWGKEVRKWQRKLSQLEMFVPQPEQIEMFGGE